MDGTTGRGGPRGWRGARAALFRLAVGPLGRWATAGAVTVTGSPYSLAEPAEILAVVRKVLAELAAEEAERALAGEPLALPPPLAGGVALAAVTRIDAAFTPAAGAVGAAATPSDIAVARHAVQVAHELLLVRSGDPDEVELATLVEDLARDAAGATWPSGEHDRAVARGVLSGLVAVLDAAAPPVEPIRELRAAGPRIHRGLPVAWALPAPAAFAAPRPHARWSGLARAAVAGGVAAVGVGVLYTSGPHTGTGPAHVQKASCERSAHDEPFDASPAHLIHLVF